MNVKIPKGNFAEHNAQIPAKEQLSKSHINEEKTKKYPKVAIYSRYGMEKGKVALYCRAASIAEINTAIDAQEEALKKYVDLHNYEIVEIIREIGSGASLNRPGINKINEITDKYKIDAVIAKNISRFGRCSYSELSNFINSLEEKGVQVITMNEGNLANIPFFRVTY